jgi:hypothetical protein
MAAILLSAIIIICFTIKKTWRNNDAQREPFLATTETSEKWIMQSQLHNDKRN